MWTVREYMAIGVRNTDLETAISPATISWTVQEETLHNMERTCKLHAPSEEVILPPKPGGVRPQI